ncbi:protein EXECUTER 2, chloroplastic-like [Macadamia integrifolia]|uniref:protein EXECUTER 2, chloroplastic-like n=1 Tax=Macadamia integrifolia TaxID=60698 RepID=UPI001C4F74E4|nr:protein EXECUTER 2, chloroplastic-like [Macadamia integrifolia]
MVVVQTWGVRIATPMPQFRNSCFDFSAKKGSNQSYLRSVLRKPIWGNCRGSKLSCRCSSSSSNWDWNQWTRNFSEIEQAESFVSVLKFQLEDAIEKEDFQEAAKLKDAIAEATSKDAVAEILSQLKNAIDEERYHDASRLCRLSGSGLVGWWFGCSKDSDDPFGRVVRITPGVGRFVARCYSPRQLVTGSPGTPLFEIFVIKDADESYTMQVVSLQKAKGNPTNSSSASKLTDELSTVGIKSSHIEGIPVNEEDKVERHEEKNVNIKDANEEGISSVISFLKDKIPGLKLKVMNIKVPEETTGGSANMEQLMQESNETVSSAENSEDEAGNVDDIQPDEIAIGEDTDTREEGKNMAMKFFIGGVLHNMEDIPSKDEYVRFPAEIIDMKRDSFVLHVPSRSKDADVAENIVPEVKVAAVAAQGVSELMPHDVAKAFLNVDKVSKDVREIVKLAVTRAQKWNTISGDTTFSRIMTSKDNLDPFDGLYVGAFGPYGTEVVQLKRKFGHWHGVDDTDECSDVEFFEYVEAVKLTGDLNVPAGQVTFRAKIGKGCRTSNQGMYPDELGVVASYKGQGRIAEFGFRNPQWVDGELLQLKGKGLGPYVKGADLGFLYVVSEQSFLVLFNRLKLPE